MHIIYVRRIGLLGSVHKKHGIERFSSLKTITNRTILNFFLGLKTANQWLVRRLGRVQQEEGEKSRPVAAVRSASVYPSSPAGTEGELSILRKSLFLANTLPIMLFA